MTLQGPSHIAGSDVGLPRSITPANSSYSVQTSCLFPALSVIVRGDPGPPWDSGEKTCSIFHAGGPGVFNPCQSVLIRVDSRTLRRFLRKSILPRSGPPKRQDLLRIWNVCVVELFHISQSLYTTDFSLFYVRHSHHCILPSRPANTCKIASLASQGLCWVGKQDHTKTSKALFGVIYLSYSQI